MQYKSFKGTAQEFMAQGIKVNGAVVDAVALCIMAKYGVAKVVGYAEKPANVRGKAPMIYSIQGKPGFKVEIPSEEVQQEQKEQEVTA